MVYFLENVKYAILKLTMKINIIAKDAMYVLITWIIIVYGLILV